MELNSDVPLVHLVIEQASVVLLDVSHVLLVRTALVSIC